MPEAVWLQAALGGVLGLLIGSFLNLVIHRLPQMMEQEWAAQCAELTGQTPDESLPALNLVTPRSRCPHCGHAITWYQNIPVLSYLMLGGRCAGCRARISLRYPLWNWPQAPCLPGVPGAGASRSRPACGACSRPC